MRLRRKRIAARLAREGMNADVMTPEWKAVLMADPCVYCHGPAAQYEHIKPRARGGKSGWSNIAPACMSCNTFKSDRPLWWALWRREEARLGFTEQRRIGTKKGRPVMMTHYTRLLPRRLSRRLSPVIREAQALGSDSLASDGESQDTPSRLSVKHPLQAGETRTDR